MRSGIVTFIGLTMLVLLGCEQSSDPPVNPFDGQVVNQDTVKLEIINPEPSSFAGIYQNILRPTCANVGCHDGTFEPDYRTMESSYNTLVYQIPIKNDGNYNFRVEPYSPQTSVLMARLNNLLTPAMPIQVEPDSDWPAKKAQYISNIQTWISNGAPDISGNIRQFNSPVPELIGAGATENDIWMSRSDFTGPIRMPEIASNVRLYFAFHHDNMMPADFQYNRIAFSGDANGFDTVVDFPLQILGAPRIERGFYGDLVPYSHYIDINPALDFDPKEAQWFFRVYVQDDQNPIMEIPNDNGIYYIKDYMSFRWAE